VKAYLIIDVNILDRKGFMTYVEKIPELIKKYSGRYLVQGVEPDVVQGADDGPQRVVIIEFPSKGDAESFLSERRNSDLHQIWSDTTDSRILLVDGCT